MSIHFAAHTEADILLKDKEFRKRWARLYEKCPWATPFQSVDYVTIWYTIYREEFHPVILSQSCADTELIGLLTLAVSADSNQLVVAGAHQAEYQVWVADPHYGNSFIETALRKIREHFPHHVMIFRYLPPATPTDWTDSDQLWGNYCQLEKVPCPIMRLTDSEKLTAHLRHRDMRKSFNRLKKMGDVRLEPISDAAGFSPVFDEFAVFYDFRQAAINGVFPFQEDPCKEPFHLALMKVPDFLYVMTLKIGDRVLASHLGIPFRKKLFSLLTGFNPFYSKYSPSSILRMLLGPKLAEQGFSAWDLTPGGDRWKERFATDYEEVSILTIFPNRRRLKQFETGQKFNLLFKHALQRFHIDPQTLKKHVTNLHPKTITHLLSECLQKIWYRAELCLYFMKTDEAAKADFSPNISRDCLKELLAFQPTKSWQDRQQFMSQALRHIEKGHHIYTYMEQGQLLQYGWLVEEPKHVFFPEVEQELNFTPGSALLSNFHTHPALRNRKPDLFLNFLQTMIHDTMASGDIEQIYITVPSNKRDLQQTVKELGFAYEYSLFKELRFGQKRLWTNKPEAESQERE